MRLSSSQLEILRTQPQQATLYMSIFEPQVIFTATINDASIGKGARTITFNNSSGSHLNIDPNFLLLVGTTAGASDVGKIRIRSATSNQFVVSENSNINWQNGLKLTVLKYVRLDPIYPRIVQNPANESDSIFYKDYDIPYSNQNSVLGTYPCAGPHRALFKGEQAWYSSTGTHSLLGDTLAFNWTFEGGIPSSSTSADPGYVTYNTPGHYVTRLQISGSSGGVDTTYRYVSVYDREDEGNSPPIVKWELSGLGGSRDEGGYKATFKVYETVPIEENAVVVLFSDDWYGNTRVSLGGNYPNAEKIFFVGYIMEGSIHYNYQHSYVEFSVGSLSEIMKQSLGFSVSVESVASPAKWYELLDMDCRRAIYHYLRWHTTALQVADFQFVGDDRKIQFFDADRASMWDAIDNLMRNTLIGKSVADRQGKVWMEVDARAYQNPTGTFTPVMEITKRDWMNQPSIEENLSDQLSFIEYGGIAYSGVNTGTFSALLASAPGNAPSFRGRADVHEGLALLGQDQLNRLVGNVWANENADHPKINIDLGISARNLDIAPQETARIRVASTDTVRGISIDNPYIPVSMDWKYNPVRQVLIPSVDFRVLVNGGAGESIVIPVSVPDAGFDTGFSVPGLQIPPLPLLTIPPLFGGLGGSATGSSCCDSLAALGVGYGVYSSIYRRNAPTPDAPFGGGLGNLGMEFSSNPNMYNASNGKMPLLNTGTIDYSISLEGRWTTTAVSSSPSIARIGIHIYLRNSDGTLAATPIEFFVGETASATADVISLGMGDSGVFSELFMASSATYVAPRYLMMTVTSNQSPPSFQVHFDQIVLRVIGE